MLKSTSAKLASANRSSDSTTNNPSHTTSHYNPKKESRTSSDKQVMAAVASSNSSHNIIVNNKPKRYINKIDKQPNNAEPNTVQSINPTDNNQASIVISKQKTNNLCDKLESIVIENDVEKHRKANLRVNLIKKSNKQLSISSLTNRRPQPKRNIEPIKVAPASPSSNEKPNSLRAPHCDESKTFPKKSTIVVSKNKSDPKKTESSAIYEKAKSSQKMVVSLIRDISQVVSKEDLTEMLKEITSTIEEVQSLEQSDSTNENSNQRAVDVKITEKKQSQDKKMKAFRKSDIVSGEQQDANESKTGLSKYSNNTHGKSPKSSSDVLAIQQPNTNHSSNNHRRSNDSIENVICNQKSQESFVHPETTSEIGFKEEENRSQSMVELSSDDDVSKNLERRPNSSRLPIRCLRVTSSHAKYISPHRKRSLEERLSRAQEAREKFLEYRANKFRDILKKVEEMRAWKEEDTMNLKASAQTKLQKAAARRKEQLDKIIRKAHDEDSKVSEIQFINNLEAQNRRHDMNSRKKEFEARLQDLQDERQRRFEEKQAKEVAAEERRKNLEAERKAKLLEIQQKRKLKIQKVEQQQQVKERKRIERNRNRDEKISAIKEAYHAGVQTLKKRINKKQEQSGHRHEVNLRLIRQKAFELSIKRYNSFISESNAKVNQTLQDASLNSGNSISNRQKDTDTKRLQLKPFNTKKFCNLCKETIGSELSLFSHLRSESHHSSINEHYGTTMLTTNEAVEIHNLRHIVDTDEPLDCDRSSNSQQSSRASSLVNYYHSSYLSEENGGICMSDKDRESLLAIEKKCRKLRHKLILAGKSFNRDWFAGKIRIRLAQLLIAQRITRNQSNNTDEASLANTIDLSANNSICQQNRPFYLKIGRITRELISITTDQRISGGGLLPAGITHNVDRLLADLNKQLVSRKAPNLTSQLLYLGQVNDRMQKGELDVDQLDSITKMIEFYAIDTLFLYDIISCLVSILRRIVPNASLTSKLPSTVASHYSTLIDPISLNSYYCHRAPILPARIYIKMIGFVRSLCENHSDLCYIIFQSNNMINLSDILSYRLGFIIGNESPASSISGSSSAATLSAQTMDRKLKHQQVFNASVNMQSGSASNSSSSLRVTTSNERNRPRSKTLPIDGSSRKKQIDVLEGKGSTIVKDANDDEVTIGNNSTYKEYKEEYEGDDADEDDVGNDDDEVEEEEEEEEEPEEEEEEEEVEEEEDEDDFWDRAETYKRTDEVVDDMTAALCRLLATVTETILSQPLILLNQVDKMAFDQRSNDFISYMVSVGIVDTESVIMSHIHKQQQQKQQKQTFTSANSASGSAAAAAASLGTFNLNLNHNHNATLPATSSGITLSSNHSIEKSLAPDALQQQQQNCSSAAAVSSCLSSVTSAMVAAQSQAASSTRNKIINFTTSCIQFVTSLVKLVIAKLPDEQVTSSGARGELQDSSAAAAAAQQDTTQLLATLKMSQLSGVLTLVYDMLVHSFNSLNSAAAGHSQQANKGAAAEWESRQLGLALESLRLINYVAYIDIRLFQDTLAADEMLPLQLRHVCSFLISHLVRSDHFKVLDCEPAKVRYRYSEQLQPANGSPPTSSAHLLLRNDLMNELILLLGNFAYLNPSNQLMLKSGRRPSTIEHLISLPFDYFSRANLKLVLMPTLISCAHLNDQICALVCQELSLSMLTSFIEDQLLSAQVESKHNSSNSQLKQTTSSNNHSLILLANELTDTKLASQRWRFERRFAKSKWLNAKKYFESQQAKASGRLVVAKGTST